MVMKILNLCQSCIASKRINNLKRNRSYAKIATIGSDLNSSHNRSFGIAERDSMRCQCWFLSLLQINILNLQTIN